MNKERLLNVARALRESPNPEQFHMSSYGHNCNTPCCAIGHYAARPDLQDAFALDKYGWLILRNGDSTNYFRPEVLEHFDITPAQASALFSGETDGDDFDEDGVPTQVWGCDSAKTAIEAAEFIEAFCDQE